MRPGPGNIDWPATLRAAGGRPRHPDELRHRRRAGHPQGLLIVILDASASTLRAGNLARAKGLAGHGLGDAYRCRWQAALILCQGGEARLLRPSQRPPKDPRAWLDPVQGGGGTPLAPALRLAARLVEHHRRRHPDGAVELRILTDGRARTPAPLPPIPARIHLIDLQPRWGKTRHGQRLAAGLGARYWAVEEGGSASIPSR